MATTAANVVVGVTGGVYGAPTGSTLPTSVVAALDSAFVDFGYIDENGVAQSIGADTTDIKAWQNGDTVRVLQTSHTLSYALSFLETNAAVLAAYYGNYAAGTVEVKGEQGIRQEWVFEVLDGASHIRLVIPDGQITQRGDISYVNGAAVVYPVTITCYPDTSGVKAYMYHSTAGATSA